MKREVLLIFLMVVGLLTGCQAAGSTSPELPTPENLYSTDNTIDMFVYQETAYVNAEDTEVTNEIVKVLYYDIKPMTPEDAKLKLQEQPQNRFLTFIDVDTGKTNVIYRLKDNKNFGLVEPEG